MHQERKLVESGARMFVFPITITEFISNPLASGFFLNNIIEIFQSFGLINIIHNRIYIPTTNKTDFYISSIL